MVQVMDEGGGQAQKPTNGGSPNVGIYTSTPTSTYVCREDTISRLHCSENYVNASKDILHHILSYVW